MRFIFRGYRFSRYLSCCYSIVFMWDLGNIRFLASSPAMSRNLKGDLLSIARTIGSDILIGVGAIDVWLYGSVSLAVVHHKEGLRSCSGATSSKSDAVRGG